MFSVLSHLLLATQASRNPLENVPDFGSVSFHVFKRINPSNSSFEWIGEYDLWIKRKASTSYFLTKNLTSINSCSEVIRIFSNMSIKETLIQSNSIF